MNDAVCEKTHKPEKPTERPQKNRPRAPPSPALYRAPEENSSMEERSAAPISDTVSIKGTVKAKITEKKTIKPQTLVTDEHESATAAEKLQALKGGGGADFASTFFKGKTSLFIKSEAAKEDKS